MTGDSQLKPYMSWVDFVQHLKHPESLINFIAAYGTHAAITGADRRWPTSARRRPLLVLGGAVIDAGSRPRSTSCNSTGAWANAAAHARTWTA